MTREEEFEKVLDENKSYYNSLNCCGRLLVRVVKVERGEGRFCNEIHDIKVTLRSSKKRFSVTLDLEHLS